MVVGRWMGSLIDSSMQQTESETDCKTGILQEEVERPSETNPIKSQISSKTSCEKKHKDTSIKTSQATAR